MALGSRRILDQIIACGVGGVVLGAHAVSWVSARLFVPGAQCWGHAFGPGFWWDVALGARVWPRFPGCRAGGAHLARLCSAPGLRRLAT